MPTPGHRRPLAAKVTAKPFRRAAFAPHGFFVAAFVAIARTYH